MKGLVGFILFIILALLATLPFHYVDVGGNFKVLTKDHFTFEYTYIDQSDVNKIIARYNAGNFIEKMAMLNEPLLKKLQENGYIIDETKKQNTERNSEENQSQKEEVNTLPQEEETKEIGEKAIKVSEEQKGKIKLTLEDKKTVTLKNFPPKDDPSEEYQTSAQFVDINNDQIPELVTNYFTGGAHCCFIYDVFKKVGDFDYKFIFEFGGGENSLYVVGDTLKLFVYEQIGYFFTSYACEFNSPDAAVINLKLINDKFQLICSEPLNQQTEKGLAMLKKRGVPPMDSKDPSSFDDGTRKAYAGYILTYYFNNNRDEKKTYNIFSQYYTGKDKEHVWEELKKYLDILPISKTAN